MVLLSANEGLPFTDNDMSPVAKRAVVPIFPFIPSSSLSLSFTH